MSAKKSREQLSKNFSQIREHPEGKKGKEISKTIDVGLLILLELKANPYG